jgi:hypothetical protein
MENTVSIVVNVTAYAEVCLPSRYLETECIAPLFYSYCCLAQTA